MQVLALLTQRQETEAKLHWSRNSYFLVVMSILILAFGQAPLGNLTQLAFFRALISFLGAGISIVWLSIQFRSSQYILYYKDEARKYKDSTRADIFPSKLKGQEMRRVVYWLPIMFLSIWITFFVFSIINLM
jgi:hypothetical protein